MIREAKLSDWEQISEISRIAGYIDYINSIGREFLNHGKVNVYCENERILGFLNWLILPDNSVWLGALRIHPDERRKGMGLALTVETIKKSGGKKARCLIHYKNEKSLNLVRKLGFGIAQAVCTFEGYPEIMDSGTVEEKTAEGFIADYWSFYVANDAPRIKFPVTENEYGTFVRENNHCIMSNVKKDFSFKGDGYSLIYGYISEIPEFLKHHLNPVFDQGYIMELDDPESLKGL